jgi:Ca-activated chloride channel family protein
MTFAVPMFLFGTALALLVGALLILGALGATRSVKKFGDPPRIRALLTADPSKRRAWKGVLLVLATALAFVAAARPQYGKGTRLVPATNIDVVLVLDYSKSMYARDVEPSRIFRAKVEVARLIKDLEGARFGAVAFAGEPMGFPLTADGAAIAQFLRQLDPNDMPVGGTAIGRALDQARDLLNRDPKAAEHKRVIVLVTDGEDLEGDPVSLARSIGLEGTTIHVVQIGGRTPERIPEVGEDGQIVGWRTDRNGKPMTTALTVQGEQQLGAIAAATPEGQVIRAEKGTTGIDKIAAELKRQMKSELAERVETVYADIYFYPLGLAILLLIAEVFLTDAPRRILPFSPAAASAAFGAPLAAAATTGATVTTSAGKSPRSGAGKSSRRAPGKVVPGFPLPNEARESSPWATFPAPPGARETKGDDAFDEPSPPARPAARPARSRADKVNKPDALDKAHKPDTLDKEERHGSK